MMLVHGYRAVSPKSAARPPDCRRQRLPAATFEECAAACLAQPFCEAATWFNPDASSADHTALRGVCVGRTSGQPSAFEPDPDASVALRTCEVAGCGLQAKMDAMCLAASRDPQASPSCRGSTTARNRRVLGRHDATLEDYEWICAPPDDSVNATMLLACVDDRGSMAACTAPRDDKQSSLNCWPSKGKGGGAGMHDLQRRGCAPPSCLATPGSGWPLAATTRIGWEQLAASPPPPSRPPLPPLPHWVRRAAHAVGGRRLSLDYSKPGGAEAFAAAFAAASSSAPRAHAARALVDAHAAAVKAAASAATSSTASSTTTSTTSTTAGATAASTAASSGSGSRRAQRDAQRDASMPERDSEPLVSRLTRLGYLNCSMEYDELKNVMANALESNHNGRTVTAQP